MMKAKTNLFLSTVTSNEDRGRKNNVLIPNRK